MHHLRPPILAALFKEKANWAAKHHDLPLIVSTDQEGGSVSRLRALYPTTTFLNPKTMQTLSADAIKAEGRKVGKALLASGVNMLLAPSLDAADVGTLMEKQGRSFGTTPEQVIARAQPWVDGVLETFPQCIVVGKHAPGYNFRGNSDVTPVTSQESLEGVRRRMRPFLEIKGLGGIMMSSVKYAAYNNTVSLFSKELIAELRAAQPNAIIMSDDIVAPSLVDAKLTGQARRDAIAQVALRAMRAGVDLVLAMDSSAIGTMSRTIVAAAQKDPAFAQRIDESFQRILAFRRRLAGVGVNPPSA